MSSTNRSIITLTFLLVVVLMAPLVHSGGFTIIELGAKKTGMMTCIAKPDDLSAVYHNPAGLADLHGTRLQLYAGFSFVEASFRVKSWPGGEGKYGSEDFITTPVDSEGYYVGTVEPTKYFGAMPMFMASSDFGFKEGPVVALAAYVPDFIGAFLPEDAPSRYWIVEGYFTAAVTSLSAGYRLPKPLDMFSLGASLGLFYVRQEAKRWQNIATLGEMNADYVLHLAGEDWRPFWNVGITARLPWNITLGASFIGGSNVELKGRLDFSLPPGVFEEDSVIKALGGLVGKYDMRFQMKVPDGLSFGISWEAIPQLALEADFRLWLYNVFHEQRIYHNIRLGTPTTSLVPNPMVIPKNYEDSWTLSVGALGKPFENLPLEFMGGWTYDHAPAPDQTKSADSPTTNLTGFSLGARYSLADTWRFSLTFYRYWYLLTKINNSILDPPQNAVYQGGVNTFSVQTELRF